LDALLTSDILCFKCETKSLSIAFTRLATDLSSQSAKTISADWRPHHNDDPCTFFKPPTRGSYNICFFVRFHPRSTNEAGDPSGQACENGDRWVVRVPLSPYLGIAAHDKLESEVAVMQYAVATDKTRAQNADWVSCY
jgi:hypothetical protein